MKEPFKKPNQEEANNETVQSLQDMMRQDESVKPQIIATVQAWSVHGNSYVIAPAYAPFRRY